MSTPPIRDDVFDPTTDPRHRPPTALPGPDPTDPRPRDVDPDQPPLPDEPAILPTGVAPTEKPADGAG